MKETRHSSQNTQPLLEIKKLEVEFFLRQGTAKALNQLNLSINENETLGIVGESGCGKSVTALAMMNLIREPGAITGGEILYHGTDLLKLSKKEMRNIRGSRIAMIFQEPMTALNPVYSIGNQLAETLILHKKFSRKMAWEKSEDLLVEVGLPNPRRLLNSYPHELSGGMRQRVMIAMALSCEPDLLIADEPSTALDVTIQAQILELIKKLQEKYRTSVVMITHDMGVIAEVADRVVVMYAGNIVEQTDCLRLFKTPRHPYTKGLMKAIPHINDSVDKKGRLYNIPGSVPTLLELPVGCRFQSRCPLVTDECKKEIPPLTPFEEGHFIRCIHAE